MLWGQLVVVVQERSPLSIDLAEGNLAQARDARGPTPFAGSTWGNYDACVPDCAGLSRYSPEMPLRIKTGVNHDDHVDMNAPLVSQRLEGPPKEHRAAACQDDDGQPWGLSRACSYSACVADSGRSRDRGIGSHGLGSRTSARLYGPENGSSTSSTWPPAWA